MNITKHFSRQLLSEKGMTIKSCNQLMCVLKLVRQGNLSNFSQINFASVSSTATQLDEPEVAQLSASVAQRIKPSSLNISQQIEKNFNQSAKTDNEGNTSMYDEHDVDKEPIQTKKRLSLKNKRDKILMAYVPEADESEDSAMASRRVDPTLVHQVYYFDTLAFVKKLEQSGFSRSQAEGCAHCLVDVVNTTLDHQGRHMVTKPQQEIVVQQLLSEIISVKKDMTLLQKSEFSTLKSDTEKMGIQMNQIESRLNDEILKLGGSFKLDVNLERSRAIEDHAHTEKELQKLHNRIDTEIANLKTVFEQHRNDNFKYIAGTVLAVATLLLGVMRLMM